MSLYQFSVLAFAEFQLEKWQSTLIFSIEKFVNDSSLKIKLKNIVNFWIVVGFPWFLTAWHLTTKTIKG